MIATEIAKYQRIIDETNGDCVILSPCLFSSLSGTSEGQFTLDLTAAMLLEDWGDKVIDATAIARTLSGVSSTDPTDVDDAGYADTAYDDLYQADNVHPTQALMDGFVDAILEKIN